MFLFKLIYVWTLVLNNILGLTGNPFYSQTVNGLRILAQQNKCTTTDYELAKLFI